MGITCLPLHICLHSHARIYDKLQEIMHRVILENFGKPIRISNDDYIPLVDRMIGMVEDQIKNGDYDDEEELDDLIHDLESSILFTKVGERLKRLKADSTAD